MPDATAIQSAEIDPAMGRKFALAAEQARRDADALQRDADSAAARGDSPEQREARLRVAQSFIRIHLAGWAADMATRYVEQIDLAQPVQVVNIAGKSEQELAPKAGFLGWKARRGRYLPGERYKAGSEGEPSYALLNTPVKGTAGGAW